MWVCSNVGFISIVEDRQRGPDYVKVRARARVHLETLFPGYVVHESHDTDYQFRVFATRADVAKVIADAIMAKPGAPGRIDYTNFKNSVTDHKLHDLYSDFWSLHWRYQHAVKATKDAIVSTARATTARLTGKRTMSAKTRDRIEAATKGVV